MAHKKGAGSSRNGRDSVITSYSIHYTKLYEVAPTDPTAYLDRMAAEIREKFQDAIVGRRGEIVEFTLSSDLDFAVGGAELKPAARESLATAADILKRYPETLVTIEGHTDSTGTVKSNQELSEKRAQSVFDILVRNGVSPMRLTVRGYGELV